MAYFNILVEVESSSSWETIYNDVNPGSYQGLTVFPIPPLLPISKKYLGVTAKHGTGGSLKLVKSELHSLLMSFWKHNSHVIELYNGVAVTKENFEDALGYI